MRFLLGLALGASLSLAYSVAEACNDGLALSHVNDHNWNGLAALVLNRLGDPPHNDLRAVCGDKVTPRMAQGTQGSYPEANGRYGENASESSYSNSGERHGIAYRPLPKCFWLYTLIAGALGAFAALSLMLAVVWRGRRQ